MSKIVNRQMERSEPIKLYGIYYKALFLVIIFFLQKIRCNNIINI